MAGIGIAGTVALAAVACLGSGCSAVGYLGQSVAGHVDLVMRARPVAELLAEGPSDAELRERLALTQRIRDWAVTELGLPDNRSYRSYADLGRSAAVWNVVAAPPWSLTLKTWCFPVMGCVGYRGYYDRAAAEQMAGELRGEGLEVAVYGVPAYSTLGWTEWFGGDPLLSTFIRWPEGELARLIFHELAHQIVYVGDDTAFNESFATAVERIGGRRWLAEQASEAARSEYATYDARRRDFRALTARTREALHRIYADTTLNEVARANAKLTLMAEMRAEHERLKAGPWQGYTGYDGWFERANNALLGVQAAYDELVPDFERLYEREGRDWARFYGAVRHLASLPKDERLATLRADP